MSDAQQAETPLSQKARDLDRKISAQVEGLVKGLQSQIGERIRAATDDVVSWIEENGPEFPHFLPESDLDEFWASLSGTKPESPAPKAGSADYGPLLEAVARLDSEQGQAEILAALLEESRRFSSRAAFFLIRDGRARGWAGSGFADADSRIGEIEEGVEEDPWKRLLEKGSTCVCSDEQLAGMAIRINTSPAEKAVLVPFAIRGQIAGALYADHVAEGTSISAPALQLLVHSAAMALETSSVSPGLSPCLRIDGELPQDATPAEAVSEDAAAAPEEPVAEEPAETTVVAEDDAAPVAHLVPKVEQGSPMAEPAPPEAPGPEIELPEAVETLSTEDLETTVVPAVSEDSDTASTSVVADTVEPEPIAEPEPEEEEETPASEPTVEIDAPALALDSPSKTSETEAVAPEPPPVEVDDFDSVSVPSDEEIALEAQPEPALEDDTNAWELEEEAEDDEPTHVGMAVQLEEPEVPSPPALEISAEPEVSAEPEEVAPAPEVAAAPQLVAPTAPEAPAPPPMTSFPGPDMPVGQETVRLPVVSPPPPAQDPGDETSPTGQIEAPDPSPVAPPAPSFTETVPPVAPPAPASFADPVPPVAPPAPSSFADSEAPPVAPSAPTSFADPAPPVAPPAPASFADPTPPPQPEPPAAEVKSAGGGSQVMPPADLEGPGLAFARAPAAAEKPDFAGEALHEEARRLARLLVSEIKLYNEEIIEEGRRAGNIYERLKDDIDRSRQMYEERIDSRLADQEDYFYQELVQRLAGGDVSLLGL